MYGHTDQTGDVFVIIDVAESAGVPAGRWIYTTRPIFLNLDPAILQFISFGLLTPPILQYRVRCTPALAQTPSLLLTLRHYFRFTW